MWLYVYVDVDLDSNFLLKCTLMNCTIHDSMKWLWLWIWANSQKGDSRLKVSPSDQKALTTLSRYTLQLAPAKPPAERPVTGPCSQPGLDGNPPRFRVDGSARILPRFRRKPSGYVWAKSLRFIKAFTKREKHLTTVVLYNILFFVCSYKNKDPSLQTLSITRF